MNKGTLEGTEEEIKFVRELNKNQTSSYWKILKLKSGRSYFAIHVTEHKFGKINGQRIKPKADIIIAEGSVSNEYLIKKDYYLTEEDMIKLNITPVPKTGISVKRIDSEKYQILKMNPHTFKKIFGCYELGAGASIFCKNEEEFSKNGSVLSGWNTDWNRFKAYFGISGEPNKSDLERIKKEATKKIFDMINNNKTISDFVFKGTGNFDEPFTATWFFERGKLKPAEKIPFIVTTGSGRSKGDFTIVVKPR